MWSKSGAIGLDVIKQLEQASPVFQFKTALTFVAVSADDRHIVQLCIGRYRSRLIFDRVALVIR